MGIGPVNAAWGTGAGTTTATGSTETTLLSITFSLQNEEVIECLAFERMCVFLSKRLNEGEH
jgi:hypothetical protein